MLRRMSSDQLVESQLDEIRARRAVQARARPRLAAATRDVRRAGGAEVLNFCANNYLGLADHPARDRGRARGARPLGLRPGLGALHLRHAGDRTRSSRRADREFLGTEDTILYSSCFDANGGLFETLLGAEDAIISDELNHASIIDGIRLCKAAALPLHATATWPISRRKLQGDAGRAASA